VALLTAQQVAIRLGIKLPSVYAYVSRGTLHRHLAADGTSRFDSRQVEQLARRGRPRLSSQVSSINLLIETSITRLSESELFYRAHAAGKLVRAYTFEEVAEYLWTADLQPSTGMWKPAEFSSPALPADQLIRVVCAQMPLSPTGWGVPLRSDVIEIGRMLISSCIEALPVLGVAKLPPLQLEGRSIRNTIAARLWPRLTAKRATPETLHALNTALIVMADHELATSTFAVRVAASTHASPTAVVLAGLGAMQGPLHGGASMLARDLLSDALNVGADTAVSQRLASGQRLAGFGHKVYVGADPRAVSLMLELRKASPQNRALVVADDLIAVAKQRIRRSPNIDLALAVFEQVADMQPGSAETIFTIARMAGWLAHALEEYEQPPLRFRVRAKYVGP
jgi:citrate synthase